MSKKKCCAICGKELSDDEVALNKKLFGKKVKSFLCIPCMAEDLQTSCEYLEDKIKQFKEEGCELFV